MDVLRVAGPVPRHGPGRGGDRDRDAAFSLLEITSGLPDGSREEDEREEERRLRDLRGRVKAARAAVPVTPGADQVLLHDWVRAAHFYARFGITERAFRQRVPVGEGLSEGDRLGDLLKTPVEVRSEARSRGEGTLPV